MIGSDSLQTLSSRCLQATHTARANSSVILALVLFCAAALPNLALANQAVKSNSKNPPLPKQGMAKTGKQWFALATNDLKAPNRTSFCGSLGRELVRQGLLLAARHEMGLNTLDASLAEINFVTESPDEYPFQLDVSYAPVNGNPNLFTVNIELSRPSAKGTWFKWSPKPLQVRIDDPIGDLLLQIDSFSRNEFVGALREAGYTKSDSSPKPGAKKNSLTPDHMDFISQFEQLRRLDQQRRTEGDTAETLCEFARSYANLGSLIDFHWSPASKASKARALLYAQRAVSVFGESSTTLSYRAYAWALTGNHVHALEDLKNARELKSETIPGWSGLVDAFCQYQLEPLETAERPWTELGLYLRMRLVDPRYDGLVGLQAVTDFSQANPACSRPIELMCESNNLGILRAVTEEGPEANWPQVYSRFISIPGLPAKVLDIANQESNLVDQPSTKREHQSRTQLIEELRTAARKLDSAEPSWNALASMLSDDSFVQLWRIIDCQSVMLAVSVDDKIDRFATFLKHHRYANCLRAYLEDKPKALTATKELLQSAEPALVEMPMLTFVVNIYQRNPDFSRRVISAAMKQRDPIFDDLLRSQLSGLDDPRADVRDQMQAVVPFQPRTVAWNVQSNQELSKEETDRLETQYAGNSYVMTALGRRFQQRFQSTDAERCLIKSIKILPTHDAYFALAYEYKERGDLKACRKTYEDCLQLEALSLERAKTAESLADLLMDEGDFEGAKPNAEIAADSYSGWGLQCYARCAEGLNDWSLAEQQYQALSERYENSSSTWYFFCLRTGRGNLKAARQLAETAWKRWVKPYSHDQIWQLCIRSIIDEDWKNARRIILDTTDKSLRDVYLLHTAAALAGKAGDTAERDSIYDEMDARFDPTFPLPRLVNLFRLALRQPGKIEWNRKSFEELASDARPGDASFCYYFAGEFLLTHGEKNLAVEYLQCAATASKVERYSCLLANLTLRGLNVPIEKTRLYRHPDEIQPCVNLVNECYRAEREGQLKVARDLLDEAIKLRPDFVLAIRQRATLSQMTGDFPSASDDLEASLKINPECEQALWQLATLRSACPDEKVRDGAEAVKLAERAMELRVTKLWMNYSLLAAANAEKGDFDQAVQFAQQALKLSPDNPDLPAQLKQYQQKKPLRFPTEG